MSIVSLLHQNIFLLQHMQIMNYVFVLWVLEIETLEFFITVLKTVAFSQINTQLVKWFFGSRNIVKEICINAKKKMFYFK